MSEREIQYWVHDKDQGSNGVRRSVTVGENVGVDQQKITEFTERYHEGFDPRGLSDPHRTDAELSRKNLSE